MTADCRLKFESGLKPTVYRHPGADTIVGVEPRASEAFLSRPTGRDIFCVSVFVSVCPPYRKYSCAHVSRRHGWGAA
eukprot:5094225-Prymnesium_polylepis.1